MASEFRDLLKAKEGKEKSAGDVVRKYLSWWPLFLTSLAICVGFGYAYTRYAIPMYAASTIINVKGETNRTPTTNNSNPDLINNALNGGRAVINLDNELSRLRSARLMSAVVKNGAFNISYFKQGNIRKTEVFMNAPFRLIPHQIQDSFNRISITLKDFTTSGVSLEYGDEDKRAKKQAEWNKPFSLNGNVYMLTPLETNFNSKDEYIVDWNPPQATVWDLVSKVDVNTLGKTTNIQLAITIENPQRGEAILNRMVEEFIHMNLDDQNRAAQDKINFIEQRLGSVSGELKGVEDTMADYQGRTLMFNGQNPAAQYGQPLEVTTKAIADINAQIAVLNTIRQYITSSSFKDKLVPSTLGLTDQVLVNLVARYNEVQLTKQRQSQILTENNPVIKDLDDQIQVLKGSILDNLNSLSRGLQVQLGDAQQQKSSFRSSVASIPQKEKVLTGINREKAIKENLYTYLLQKREETALSKSTVSVYEQIDFANSFGPVSPNRKSTMIYAFIIGLAIPFGIIFMRDLLNNKVSDQYEVADLLPVPLVGEVNHIKKLSTLLPVLEPGITSEQFRQIRTNLNLLGNSKGNQVILVTSYTPDEGKSLISLNLAVMMARSGKKTALLEFDLRKPADSHLPGATERGLSDYLQGLTDLAQITYGMADVPNLAIIPNGEITPDAGDLLSESKLLPLFNELKGEYDVIVVNTPPLDIVSDAILLGQYCNIQTFVVRQGVSNKKHLKEIHDQVKKGMFSNPFVIFNGVKNNKKSSYEKYSEYFQPSTSSKKSEKKKLTANL